MAEKGDRTKIIIGIVIIVGVIILSYILFPSGDRRISAPEEPSGDFEEVEPLILENMNIQSSAFENQGNIPSKHTCDGEDVSPPLTISEVPEEAQSLVLIVDDPDASAGAWAHWVVFNIDPKTTLIEENSVPERAIQGLNDFGKQTYGGPCPPSGIHRYSFSLYALDSILELEAGSKKQDIENAVAEHMINQTELVGLYQRENN